ncbi:DNA topoisomerase IV subunit A [Loigolactobacillus backii]|uniref:DNA topoisomerase IV subunit A n=1 Tax=Loigolactobacillus backii TaxID=375175 RepID=UPI0022FD7B36|nr:DNA topoisomerase IV subunit A [Loigolactobacillus backii]MDA5387022.1 DNA topoisomerase IV subunit A [Loigolactobacillus backii]MDA5389560.1 DNA topoisomerase IV subunit A [Loigolactobacillus backii]
MSENQENIQELTLEEVMSDRFGRYAKYIIQERALPDIRDGLKPVQRRILYAMNQDGNTYDKGFRKSAKSVGNVMGNFHPHGDSSIYEAMVRLSQDWKLRAPLIDMHGNNGSMDGDSPAAMRYTEARLSKIAGELLKDIDKDTVDWVLNFDDTEEEPTVLPARFPNLLVNGASGISAGYATEIPPHNLTEVIDALIYLIDNPQASLDKLMTYVKGPDFPTGGIIQGLDGIWQAYETGKGRIVVRSKTSFQELRGGRQQIVVSELPYEVNKAVLVKRIDEIRLLKKVDGISEVRDESDRRGMTVVVELKKNADGQGILNYLLKNTDLQITYNFNMVAINKQRPEQLGLKPILEAYLAHQRNVITKRTQFDLKKAQTRQHIVLGLIKALSILDQVIKVIRQSENKKNAKDNLVTSFAFTDAQAEAIVSLQLYRLTNTDITALRREQANLAEIIKNCQQILNDPSELAKVLKKELRQIKKDYGTKRLSEIQAEIENIKIDTKVLVPEEDVIVAVSHDGYLKRSSLRSYNSTTNDDNGLKEDDFLIFQQVCSTLDHLWLFTNKGNFIYRTVYELADVRWKDTGEHISQTIGLDADEEIIQTFAFSDLQQPGYFVLATTDGYIKQTPFKDFAPTRTYKTRAAQAIKLKASSTDVTDVIYVLPETNLDVFLASQHGYGLRYALSEVPVTGAKASGAKSMALKDDDSVVNLALVSPDEATPVVIITQRGALKRMNAQEITKTTRARRGMLLLRELKRNPHRVQIMTTAPKDKVLIVQTTTRKKFTLTMGEHPLADRYSNGSFVIDTVKDGIPVLAYPVVETEIEPQE